MLFLTVYGRELESIFYYIYEHTQKNGSVSREQLYSDFLPLVSPASKGQTKNIDDGINYLKSSFLIEGDKIYNSAMINTDTSLPFSALLLRQFRKIELISLEISHNDLLYITLLEQLYILPNRMWISDVHAAVNQLELARQVGGISQEKIGAWKRVMEFLGLGYRFGSGFYCLYHPKLINAIAQRWTLTEGTLQDFFENYLQSWIPCLSMQGDLALPIACSFDQLVQDGHIRLHLKQDSPSKTYFDNRRMRGIEIL